MKKVLVFGTFDPLHKGHLNLFEQAKALGDYLVVVVSPDEKIRKEKKRTPRQSEGERVESIKKTHLVDEVLVGEKSGKYKLVEKIKPDIIAVGYDQKTPEALKEKLKKYKIVKLKPHKPEIYKSSKLGPII
jgi:FAD synthetase